MFGNAAEIADVEEAVVGRAVVAGKAAAIHAEHDVEILQADVVDDLVEGALQEGGVNGAETACSPWTARPAAKSAACSSAMPTSKYLSGCFGLEKIERGAVGHGAGDGDDLRVHVGQLDHRLGKDLRVGLRAGRGGLDRPFRGRRCSGRRRDIFRASTCRCRSPCSFA